MDTLTVSGTVQADPQRLQQVTSLVSGRIERVGAVVGDRVRKGAELAVIASAEIADMKGKLIEAEARLRVAQAAAARTHRLVEIGAAAGKEAQTTEADLQAADAEVAHLRGALGSFGADARSGGERISTVTLYAPMGGVVTERTVNPGAGVQAGQNLFTLADLRTLWVIANVNESQLPLIESGAPAEVHSRVLARGAVSGVIDYIDPSLKPETHTAAVRIRVTNPGEALRIGMFVDVRIRTAASANRPSLAWIPEAAVDHIGERTVVFQPVAGHPGVFRVRDIQVGEASGGAVPVLAGLRAGEPVVIHGTFTLKSELLQNQLGDND